MTSQSLSLNRCAGCSRPVDSVFSQWSVPPYQPLPPVLCAACAAARAILPARTTDRLALAQQHGFLTTTQTHGCSAWLDECRLRQRPLIMVIRDRRHWRLGIEMERWRLTNSGQTAITALLAEHGAANIIVQVDAVYAYQLSQWAAELIAGRLVAWVRAVETEQRVSAEGGRQ